MNCDVHSESIRIATAQWREWFVTSALPLWSGKSVDHQQGGFYERIGLDGAPIDDPRRTRLIARQIFVFCRTADWGWVGSGKSIARHGLDFFHKHCMLTDGRVRSLVSFDDPPKEPTFDLYDHAFALFGLAAAAQSELDASRQLEVAVKIHDAMIVQWKHQRGGFVDCDPLEIALRTNPHMHLLEAALELQAIAPEDQRWEVLADDIAELALAHLRHPEHGAIGEVYQGDWDLVSAQVDRVIEPGHQFEWAWLMMRWGQWRQRADAISMARNLVTLAEQYGVNDQTGLVLNSLQDDLSVRDGHHRLWPQTERIKAQLMMAEMSSSPTDRKAALKAAAQAASALRQYCTTEIPGLWFETIREDGSRSMEPSRGSSLYHIAFAVDELGRFVDGQLS